MRRSEPTRRWNGRDVAALAGLLVVAACSSSASATPSPSSAAPTPSAAAASPSVTACSAPTICEGPLAAGDYESETTGAHVELTLDEHGWSGSGDVPGDGFSLFLADIPEAAISVVSFSGEVFAQGCSSDGTTTIGTSPAEFMDFLNERNGVYADDPPTDVRVGGQPAVQMDLTTRIDDECAATGDGKIWLWTLPVAGDFHFVDGEQARVLAVDAGSATVIIVIEALPGIEDYDHLLEHGAELVDTMRIRPLH